MNCFGMDETKPDVSMRVQDDAESEDSEAGSDSSRVGGVRFSAYAELVDSMSKDPIDHLASFKRDKKSSGITKRKRRKKSKKIMRAKSLKKRQKVVNALSDEIVNQLDLNKNAL